jgi:hypothetical protein
MRKLLINSTALATVAGLTASVAIADVSISAATEMSQFSRDSKIAANVGTYQTQSSEVIFNFTNKTDNGLTVAYTLDLNSDVGAAAADRVDESFFSVSGGFGKVVLGQTNDAADAYAIDSDDLIAEEINTGAADSATIDTDSDMDLNSDAAKIAYHIPAMGGFSAGVSMTDNGTAADATIKTDIISMGARYTMDLDGTSITIGTGSSSQDTAVGSISTNSSNLGIKVVMGNISAIVSQSSYKATDEDRSADGLSLSYAMGNGFTLGAYQSSGTDADDLGEKYSNTGLEVQYAIASGLTAVLNYETYDYDAGTSDETTSDDGNISKLTIKAAF